MGEKLGVICPFCPNSYLITGNGQAKAKVAIRDHLAQEHPDTAAERKLRFVRTLRLRPWADVLSD